MFPDFVFSILFINLTALLNTSVNNTSHNRRKAKKTPCQKTKAIPYTETRSRTYYFRTKEQMFIKVLDKNQQELFASIRPVMTMNTENVWETIKGGVSLFFDFLNTHRRYASMIYDVQSQNPELLNRYRKNTLETLGRLVASHKEMMEREMESGRMNKLDVFQLFYGMMSMCFVTFLSFHAIEDFFGHDPGRIDEFIGNRKEEILKTLYLRLYGKT